MRVSAIKLNQMYFGYISRVLLQALLRAMRVVDFTTLISIMSFIVSNVRRRTFNR